MKKINFVNNSEPAINDVNLNKMQDNTEDAINELQEEQNDKIKTTKTISDTDIYSCNYINEVEENIYEGEKYSTTETKTNKVWINDKPIYSKYTSFSNQAIPSQTWTEIPVPKDGMEQLVGVFVGDSNYGSYYPVSANRDQQANVCILNYRNNNITINFAVVEYTKTTD